MPSAIVTFPYDGADVERVKGFTLAWQVDITGFAIAGGVVAQDIHQLQTALIILRRSALSFFVEEHFQGIAALRRVGNEPLMPIDELPVPGIEAFQDVAVD